MRIQQGHMNGWACDDCAMFIANGETPVDMNEEETAQWLASIERETDGVEHTTMGRIFGEEGCAHTSELWHAGDSTYQEDHALVCEQQDFTWKRCDHCGSTLGGSRSAITFFFPVNEDDVMRAVTEAITVNDPHEWIMWDDGDSDLWGAVLGMQFDIAEVLYVRCSDGVEDEDTYERVRDGGQWGFRAGALIDDSWRMTEDEARTGEYGDDVDMNKVMLDRLTSSQLVAIGDVCDEAVEVLRKLGKDY